MIQDDMVRVTNQTDIEHTLTIILSTRTIQITLCSHDEDIKCSAESHIKFEKNFIN
jgi:hypothetical protein